MNFSEAFQQTKKLVRFSPNGRYIASCSQHRLAIRDASTLSLLSVHTCVDAIDTMQWSPDSLLVMCGMYQRSVVQIWLISNTDWTCKIDEGSIGLLSCCWSPDSRHILNTSNFHLRISIWSLVDKSVLYIKNPKPEVNFVFTHTGDLLVLSERANSKDYICVFECSVWKLHKRFMVETDDLGGLALSPNGKFICIWDGFFKHKALLYSIDGNHLATYTAPECILGIRNTSWSPSNQFLVIGQCDQSFVVLNTLSWKPLAFCEHPQMIPAGTAIYTEVQDGQPLVTQASAPSKYQVVTIPFQVPMLYIDPEKPVGKCGVGTLLFSPDGKYVATVNGNTPTVVWVWTVPTFHLCAALVQLQPVSAVQWDPTSSRLAICTHSDKLYMWSSAGCVSISMPRSLGTVAESIVWHPAGTSVALVDSSQFCVCYLCDI